ncbi:MAG: altronate dehydratase [Lentisphaerae bacterium]|nr:altronate dehydratase [Lentisphaerota bacterium]MBT5607154.1 altronate dehydratase [Lentisphaerota bacterium]MBT7059484.1 altronate dehydratase [Lentisphaerota bacterium]MBT7840321.1 altronate dehydratase [Lentisphaerota bacterium]
MTHETDEPQCRALMVSPDDNVAVAFQDVPANTSVSLAGMPPVVVVDDVAPGHRFAVRGIPRGEAVRQYGEPIGTSLGLTPGQLVSTRTMSDDIPLVRDLPPDLSNPPPVYVDEVLRPVFEGIPRADGRVGTRNWILIAPTSMCASHEATQVAWRGECELAEAGMPLGLDGVVAIPHNKGCGCPDGASVDVVFRMLASYASHPNVGGVVFIDLGCEKTNQKALRAYLGARGLDAWQKPVSWITIQDVGGSVAAVEAGLAAVREMVPQVSDCRRCSVPVSELVLGLECGASDGLSGLSANPALGRTSDRLVQCGGTVLLTEVPEICGAEHVLARRGRNAEVGKQIYALVDWYVEQAARLGVALGENRSAGNIRAGLLNIAIKSLGAIVKAGTTRVEGVLDYGTPVAGKGLHVMQGPGYDQESLPGVVGGGATVVVFTTGLGTPIGNAIVPVIKVAGSSALYARMRDDMDLNAGGILEGRDSIDSVGESIFDVICAVAGGQRTRAEANGHREFQIWGLQDLSL